ncbi:hypothetical protein [Paraurantiacibacter namhicola]|uniref:DoxX n=1 Tax=Paraurantiacibacter namhicola TaxID=645517 RepID=A0A1C7DAP1_9SPHN|nr:hypothetical protein [Paraurantiacibacter namhicola]ANU08515.1 hypothetical protein A6F65_02231 [Paraurantiacibacter namhicola]
MENRTKAPWHLWVIGILATLWNSGGAYDYTMTQTRNMDYLQAGAEMAGIPVETMVDYYTNFPVWADAMWAFGVWGALAGSLLLLIRSRFAFHAFAVALIGLIGTSIHTFGGGMPAELSSGANYVFTAIIFIVTIFLIWYARRMTARGVLR